MMNATPLRSGKAQDCDDSTKWRLAGLSLVAGQSNRYALRDGGAMK